MRRSRGRKVGEMDFLFWHAVSFAIKCRPVCSTVGMTDALAPAFCICTTKRFYLHVISQLLCSVTFDWKLVLLMFTCTIMILFFIVFLKVQRLILKTFERRIKVILSIMVWVLSHFTLLWFHPWVCKSEFWKLSFTRTLNYKRSRSSTIQFSTFRNTWKTLIKQSF